MFADRLKRLRKEHGYTQESLAAVIGVERSSVGKYEGKSGVIPSNDVLARIADLFGVSIDYLLERDDRKQILKPSPRGNNYVWVSLEPGSASYHYHKTWSCTLSYNLQQVPLTLAIECGYKACKRCFGTEYAGQKQRNR